MHHGQNVGGNLVPTYAVDLIKNYVIGTKTKGEGCTDALQNNILSF